MKYREKGAKNPTEFLSWQPSTWPSPPSHVDGTFVTALRRILDESMLDEIRNVIDDVTKSNGDLQHRGHVIAISLMCALDALSSYGFRGKYGKHVEKFVRDHFPPDYQPHARAIYKMYRNSLIHSWNLFEAAISPGNEAMREHNHTLSFGLLAFRGALLSAFEDFLEKLETDSQLQWNTLDRYTRLRRTARH